MFLKFREEVRIAVVDCRSEGDELITKKFVVMMGTEFPWMLLMVAHILQIE